MGVMKSDDDLHDVLGEDEKRHDNYCFYDSHQTHLTHQF
jgi:hypothetical protein